MKPAIFNKGIKLESEMSDVQYLSKNSQMIEEQQNVIYKIENTLDQVFIELRSR